MPSTREIDREIRDALRFFWAWLLLSSAVSIAGNAAHAVMAAPPAATVVAGLVAMVPPVVLLAATHGVAMLVKLRRTSLSLVIAATLTLGLGGLAFILSFDALSDLAQVAGIQPSRAWMWPAAVDGGITLATVAIFGLSRLATPVVEQATAGADVGDSNPSDSLPSVRPHIAATGTVDLSFSNVETPPASIHARHLGVHERADEHVAIAPPVVDGGVERPGVESEQQRIGKTSTERQPRRRRVQTFKSTDEEPASQPQAGDKPLIRIGSRTSHLTAPV